VSAAVTSASTVGSAVAARVGTTVGSTVGTARGCAGAFATLRASSGGGGGGVRCARTGRATAAIGGGGGGTIRGRGVCGGVGLYGSTLGSGVGANVVDRACGCESARMTVMFARSTRSLVDPLPSIAKSVNNTTARP